MDKISTYQLMEETKLGSRFKSLTPYWVIDLNFYPSGNGSYAITKPLKIEPIPVKSIMLNTL